MKRKVESQPKIKLYYFNINGKGEAIRLYCAYAGLQLEDYRFPNRDEFLAMKADGTLDFGQVPMLEVTSTMTTGEIKTQQLVQSSAILRYLSNIAGLHPQNDHLTAARIDALMDQETDAFMGATIATYAARNGISLETEDAKAKTLELLSKDVLPRHLNHLERLLKESSTGWLAGTEEPSPPDFQWYCRLALYLPENSDRFAIKLEEYPGCEALVKKFQSLDFMKEYAAEK
mmetsp:Transcript_59375/g.69405  ORF Transcript_59375/g.69405 Transcript_59375/m.69405 type:complete len:231 (+) Transcript_59375:88-780(+)